MKVHGRPVLKRKIADLREHPRQQELFGDIPDGQLDELAADIDLNGQRDPVEILDDGTIIDGHQRCRAAEKLGRDEVDVVIRNDLAVAGDAAIQMYMISVNLMRRQMDILAIARAYRYMKQIETGPDEVSGSESRELRDRLAKRLGTKLSGRTLERYAKLIDTPRAVQDAISRQELSMGAALKVAKLSECAKEGIAAAIRGGQSAKDAIDAHFEACRLANEAVARQIPQVPTTPTVSPSTGDTVEIQGDMGELQSSLDILQGAILEVIDSELPLNRKLAAVNEATTVFQDTLIEHEQWCRADGEPDALDEQDEE